MWRFSLLLLLRFKFEWLRAFFERIFCSLQWVVQWRKIPVHAVLLQYMNYGMKTLFNSNILHHSFSHVCLRPFSVELTNVKHSKHMMVVKHGLLPNNCRQQTVRRRKIQFVSHFWILAKLAPGFKRLSPKTQFEEFPHNAFPRNFFELEITGNPKIIK